MTNETKGTENNNHRKEQKSSSHPVVPSSVVDQHQKEEKHEIIDTTPKTRREKLISILAAYWNFDFKLNMAGGTLIKLPSAIGQELTKLFLPQCGITSVLDDLNKHHNNSTPKDIRLYVDKNNQNRVFYYIKNDNEFRRDDKFSLDLTADELRNIEQTMTNKKHYTGVVQEPELSRVRELVTAQGHLYQKRLPKSGVRVCKAICKVLLLSEENITDEIYKNLLLDIDRTLKLKAKPTQGYLASNHQYESNGFGARHLSTVQFNEGLVQKIKPEFKPVTSIFESQQFPFEEVFKTKAATANASDFVSSPSTVSANSSSMAATPVTFSVSDLKTHDEKENKQENKQEKEEKSKRQKLLSILQSYLDTPFELNSGGTTVTFPTLIAKEIRQEQYLEEAGRNYKDYAQSSQSFDLDARYQKKLPRSGAQVCSAIFKVLQEKGGISDEMYKNLLLDIHETLSPKVEKHGGVFGWRARHTDTANFNKGIVGKVEAELTAVLEIPKYRVMVPSYELAHQEQPKKDTNANQHLAERIKIEKIMREERENKSSIKRVIKNFF